VKGAVDELVGVVKQKTGELTDNSTLQLEGKIQEVKGKVEESWGKAKDGARNTKEGAVAGSKPVE
jgi:uncharacterized protein YjbJ (UPF0337 family)